PVLRTGAISAGTRIAGGGEGLERRRPGRPGFRPGGSRHPVATPALPARILATGGQRIELPALLWCCFARRRPRRGRRSFPATPSAPARVAGARLDRRGTC